jgi:tRNA(Arg) A34 adenosine deaminase TadA
VAAFSLMNEHEEFMRLALKEALESSNKTRSPGWCFIIKDGKVLARATTSGKAHKGNRPRGTFGDRKGMR